jgi:hypothetical protein
MTRSTSKLTVSSHRRTSNGRRHQQEDVTNSSLVKDNQELHARRRGGKK